MSELIDIQTDYEYVLNQVRGNVLNLEAMFQSGQWSRDELRKIRDELVDAGHSFAAAQGLGGTNLDAHIKAEITTNGVNFTNNATDRGRYYAGHVEYGHKDRGGGFVPARPFMRPAMYAVAEASMGRLAGSVERWLKAMWSVNALEFGHANPRSSYTRAFYKNEKYMTENAGKKNTLSKQNPSKIRAGNESYNVYRSGKSEYSSKVMSNFGWK